MYSTLMEYYDPEIKILGIYETAEDAIKAREEMTTAPRPMGCERGGCDDCSFTYYEIQPHLFATDSSYKRFCFDMFRELVCDYFSSSDSEDSEDNIEISKVYASFDEFYDKLAICSKCFDSCTDPEKHKLLKRTVQTETPIDKPTYSKKFGASISIQQALFIPKRPPPKSAGKR